MRETPNLSLKLPDLTDYVNIEDINDNMTVLDAEIAEINDPSTGVGAKLTTHLDENAQNAHAIQNITGLQEVIDAKQNSLPVENRRKITFGTDEPTGGVDGDIYFQYE